MLLSGFEGKVIRIVDTGSYAHPLQERLVCLSSHLS